jgi:hypothetical protein
MIPCHLGFTLIALRNLLGIGHTATSKELKGEKHMLRLPFLIGRLILDPRLLYWVQLNTHEVHFRTACNDGQTLGSAVGDYILGHALLPIHGDREGQVQH